MTLSIPHAAARPHHTAEGLPDWGLGPFVRPASGNPVITPGESLFDCPLTGAPVAWEKLHTFNPAAIVRDGRVWLLYRAEDDSGEMNIGGHTSRLGLAVSDDGIHFTRFPTPVVFPDQDAFTDLEWQGGCEDPRLVEAPDGRYILTYTMYSREHHSVRLGVAESWDLLHWTKRGYAFAQDLRWDSHRWSKSGGIVTSLQDGRLRAVRINGHYWMYWGEFGVNLAWSDNLLDWHPVPGVDGQDLILPPRPGLFDSALAEGGPPPILTDRGIVVLYNGKNDAHDRTGDPTLPAGIYSGGQALFSANEPGRLLERTTRPFFRPAESWEKTGQYTDGTTFIEGLVFFQARWFLYYGCADSLVGVAILEQA